MGCFIGTPIRPPAFQQPTGGSASSGVALMNTVETQVPLDLVLPGFTDGIEDLANDRITPGPAGYYSMAGKVNFGPVVADTPYEIVIKADGVNIHGSNLLTPYGAGSVFCQLVIPSFYLTAGQHVTLWATSYSGGDLCRVIATDTVLIVQRVR